MKLLNYEKFKEIPYIPEKLEIDENIYQDMKIYFTKLPEHLSIDKIQFLFDVEETIAEKIFKKLKKEVL